LDVEKDITGARLVLNGISGLGQRWNETHPFEKIIPGDFIESINGVGEDNPEKILAELNTHKMHEFMIFREVGQDIIFEAIVDTTEFEELGIEVEIADDKRLRAKSGVFGGLLEKHNKLYSEEAAAKSFFVNEEHQVQKGDYIVEVNGYNNNSKRMKMELGEVLKDLKIKFRREMPNDMYWDIKLDFCDPDAILGMELANNVHAMPASIIVKSIAHTNRLVAAAKPAAEAVTEDGLPVEVHPEAVTEDGLPVEAEAEAEAEAEEEEEEQPPIEEVKTSGLSSGAFKLDMAAHGKVAAATAAAEAKAIAGKSVIEVWNYKNPYKKVQAGDWILEVNDVRRNPEALLEECTKHQFLNMKVYRQVVFESDSEDEDHHSVHTHEESVHSHHSHDHEEKLLFEYTYEESQAKDFLQRLEEERSAQNIDEQAWETRVVVQDVQGQVVAKDGILQESFPVKVLLKDAVRETGGPEGEGGEANPDLLVDESRSSTKPVDESRSSTKPVDGEENRNETKETVADEPSADP